MRAYVPVSRAQLAALGAGGSLAGPLRACVVDPAWRAGAPEVDEEEWEYEAQGAAAAALGPHAGAVLAVDADPAGLTVIDGWVDLPGPLVRRDLACVLDADLGWFAVQEIGQVLERLPDRP